MRITIGKLNDSVNLFVPATGYSFPLANQNNTFVSIFE